jgi:hypothetical protein
MLQPRGAEAGAPDDQDRLSQCAALRKEVGRLRRLVAWFVMQTQKVIGPEGQGGVGPTIVTAEFHFENFRTEDLHNGTHLSANQTGFGHVAHQSYDGKEFDSSHLPSFLKYST